MVMKRYGCAIHFYYFFECDTRKKVIFLNKRGMLTYIYGIYILL